MVGETDARQLPRVSMMSLDVYCRIAASSLRLVSASRGSE